MSAPIQPAGIELFSTCPQWTNADRRAHVRRVAETAEWSEDAGCRGILVYTDNSQPDPWMVSQIIATHTDRLSPLVAVQPVYMHPYSVAKLVASFGQLFGRQMHLNMVAGGFTNDLKALGDVTEHDRRYDRLTEYGVIIKRLLESPAPVTFTGEFYQTSQLKIDPPIAPELAPVFFMSGSSGAGRQASAALGARAIKYPKPASQESAAVTADGQGCGIRVGIVARDSEQDAWVAAHERFPHDRRGQLMHALAMKTSDSHWHAQLSQMADDAQSVYWLGPFEQYQTMCPYLVGSYDTVADELSRYLERGFDTFILDIPPDRAELDHINRAFIRALARVAA
jgi:alkanesulfonate monooxygenase